MSLVLRFRARCPVLVILGRSAWISSLPASPVRFLPWLSVAALFVSRLVLCLRALFPVRVPTSTRDIPARVPLLLLFVLLGVDFFSCSVIQVLVQVQDRITSACQWSSCAAPFCAVRFDLVIEQMFEFF